MDGLVDPRMRFLAYHTLSSLAIHIALFLATTHIDTIQLEAEANRLGKLQRSNPAC